MNERINTIESLRITIALSFLVTALSLGISLINNSISKIVVTWFAVLFFIGLALYLLSQKPKIRSRKID